MMLLRRRWRWLLLVIFVSVLLTLAHPLWLPPIGDFLVVQDPLRPADAIVPLAGGPFRVELAARLFHHGYADWLVATDPRSDRFAAGQLVSEQTANEAWAYGVPANQIKIIGVPVTSTYTEALAVRQLAEEQRWRSLIVVTSARHTRRSRIIFHHVFANSEIRISVQPARDLGDTEPWWQNPWQRQFVFREYMKLAAFWAGYRADPYAGHQ